MGFVAARHAPQVHPILFELHQRIVSVQTTHRLPQPVEHGQLFARTVRYRIGRDRLGIVRHHVVLLLFATGKSGAPLITDANDPRVAEFSKALGEVMLDLALQVVRDGEGAEKLIKIDVTGATSEASARKIGLEIANSPLVKTAIAGGDANWGRIVMAVGKAYEPIDLDKLTSILAVKAAPQISEDELKDPDA